MSDRDIVNKILEAGAVVGLSVSDITPNQYDIMIFDDWIVKTFSDQSKRKDYMDKYYFPVN